MRNVVKGGANSCVNRFPGKKFFFNYIKLILIKISIKGMSVLSRKIALTQAVYSMKYLFPNEYCFYPNSWILPSQLNEFREHIILMSQNNKRHTLFTSKFSTKQKNLFYIVKPDDGFYIIKKKKSFL